MALYGKKSPKEPRNPSEQWQKFKNCIQCIYKKVYGVTYYTGAKTIRLFSTVGQGISGFMQPVGRVMFKAVDRFILRHARAFKQECLRIGQGFPMAAALVKQAYREKPMKAVGQVCLLPYLAVRRHKKVAVSILNLAAPVMAVFVLVATIQHWSTLTFALAVEYDGESIGYVSDESVFDAGAELAVERVNNTDNSFHVRRTPKMTITVASRSDIMDENAVCDKILRTSGDEIAEVSGLYIDGEFEGSVTSRSELEALLQKIKSKHLTGKGKERAEFVKDVRIIDGLYPISSIVNSQQIEDILTASSVVEKRYTVRSGDSVSRIAALHDMSQKELKALNPGLEEDIYIGDELLVQRSQPFMPVKVVRTVEYTEAIPYTTKKIQDSTKYLGYESVRTNGHNGSQKVVAEVTVIDGVEQSRNILSTKITKKPVTKVMVVGAKKYNSNTVLGDGVSTGRFIWPVPGFRMISSDFGYRWGSFHSALDISGSGIHGKPIVAADGGTVVDVNTNGWGGSYGLYVLIDHGNGYRTMYAHASKVLVRRGQKVAQGQIIANVGSTGYSTGPHLHFEVRLNGQPVDPKPYLR